MSGKSRAFFLACPTGEDLGQVKGGPKQAAGRPNTGQKKDACRACVFHAMLSHTRMHGQGLRTTERPNSGFEKAKAFTGLCEPGRVERGPAAGCRETQQGAPKKPRAEHPWRVENDLSSVGSQELFFSPAPLARTHRTGGKGTQAGCRETQQGAGKKCLQGGPRCFSRHAGHTQDAWTGPGDCRETQLRVRKSHELFFSTAPLARTQDR